MAKLATQMVCINCDQIFDFGRFCPVCASSQVYPLGRWLRNPPEKPVVKETVFSSRSTEMVAAWTR